MIAEIQAQSKVVPGSRFNSRAEIEVECAGAGDHRGLPKEILCRRQLGVARWAIAAEANTGGYERANGFVRAVEKVQRVSRDLMEVNAKILNPGRDGLRHLQPI